MAGLQIIGAAQSNYVWTCRIACHEKGVPYEFVPGRPHSPEVSAIHPFGKIPVLRHGDFGLCESRAICGYVDQAFPGPSLFPDDPVAAARVEQWISLVNTGIDPLLIRQYILAYAFPGTPDGSPNRDRIAAALPKMPAQLELLDRTIGAQGHLAGPGFTLADAFVFPILFYLGKFPESSAMLARTASLPAYVDRLRARPSIAASAPPPLRT